MIYTFSLFQLHATKIKPQLFQNYITVARRVKNRVRTLHSFLQISHLYQAQCSLLADCIAFGKFLGKFVHEKSLTELYGALFMCPSLLVKSRVG